MMREERGKGEGGMGGSTSRDWAGFAIRCVRGLFQQGFLAFLYMINYLLMLSQ